jgi:hypothetical protein
MALICAVGHPLAGERLFYRPIKAAIADDLHAGVLTDMSGVEVKAASKSMA